MKTDTPQIKMFEKEIGITFEEAVAAWKSFAFIDRYISHLEAKLTWRQISEKPENETYFLVNPIVSDDPPRVLFFHEGWEWEKFTKTFGITEWLPIPPILQTQG